MSQCHDLYEMPPYRPTTPEPVIVSQCHDLYLEMTVTGPGPDDNARTDLAGSRQPAYA